MKTKEVLKVTITLIVVVVWSAGVVGCTTAPECPPEPDWMRNPEQSGYYVGVGAANSGNQADDRPVAEARARADLAARISTQITSELQIKTTDSSDGYSQEVAELVNQSVETNLQDIETVDTYYCPSSGYWVYMRLGRAKWDAIQQQRRSEVVKRVRDLLEPVLNDDTSALTTRIERLQRSYDLIRAATFGQKLQGTIAGESGNLSDLVLNSIQTHSDSLRMRLDQNEIKVQMGELFTLSGSLNSNLTKNTGTVPVLFTSESGLLLAESKTDERGTFTIQLPEGLSEVGEQKLLVSAELDTLRGLDDRELHTAYAELVVEVRLINAGLIVEVKNSAVERSVESEVRALFSERQLPFEFSPQEIPGGYNLTVDLFVEDYPKYIEDAPDMAKAWAVVSLEREGRSVYSYESDFVKDGGITPAQAHSRVLSKLLKQLRSEAQLFENIKTALKEN
jgi:hypothetical protein